MSRKVTILIICGLAIACIFATQMPTAEVAAQRVQKAQGTEHAPPDIKEGAKISFVGAKAYAGIGAGKPATVVRVQGNWVYLKGDFSFENVAQTEGWFNFDTVSWYKLAKE